MKIQCQSCLQNVEELAWLCSHCGASKGSLLGAPMSCRNCGVRHFEAFRTCPSCGNDRGPNQNVPWTICADDEPAVRSENFRMGQALILMVVIIAMMGLFISSIGPLHGRDAHQHDLRANQERMPQNEVLTSIGSEKVDDSKPFSVLENTTQTLRDTKLSRCSQIDPNATNGVKFTSQAKTILRQIELKHLHETLGYRDITALVYEQPILCRAILANEQVDEYSIKAALLSLGIRLSYAEDAELERIARLQKSVLIDLAGLEEPSCDSIVRGGKRTETNSSQDMNFEALNDLLRQRERVRERNSVIQFRNAELYDRRDEINKYAFNEAGMAFFSLESDVYDAVPSHVFCEIEAHRIGFALSLPTPYKYDVLDELIFERTF